MASITASSSNMFEKMQRLILFSFITLSSAPIKLAQATDFTMFLNHELSYQVQKLESVVSTERKVEEKYLAADQFGNSYRLSVMAPLRAQAAVTTSIFYEALGIPNFPLYPAFGRRGEGGIMTTEKLQTHLNPAPSFDVVGTKEAYFPVVLQSLTYEKSEIPKNLTTLQLAEIFEYSLSQFLTGNFNEETDPLKQMTLYNGHFYPNDLTRSFQNFFARKDDLIRLRQQLKWFKGRSFVGPRAAEFTNQINLFLSHVEKFTDADFEEIFSDFFKAKEGYQQSKGEAIAPLMKEFKERVRILRSIVTTELEHLSFSSQLVTGLHHAVPAQRPILHMPEIKLKAGEIPDLESKNPVELLWALYFSENRDIFAEAFRKWRGELHHSPITSLQAKASKDNTRFYFINAYSDLNYISNYREKNTFEALNPHLEDTLFAFSVNDLESEHIFRLLERANAKVLRLSTTRGTHVDESIEKIVMAAKEAKVKRVVTIELPPKDLQSEQKIREQFKFFYIDHHAMGDIDRFNKRSSLEQVAMFIGHKLTFEDFVVGVNDAAIIYGLRDLGLSKENIKHFLDYATNGHYKVSNYVKSLMPQETSHGKVFISYNDHFSLGRTSGQLAYNNYPETVSGLLLEDGKVRFSGTPELARKLMNAFKDRTELYQLMFSGGDEARAKFMGLKRIPNHHFDEVLSIIEKTLGIAIDRSKLDRRVSAELRKSYIQAKELRDILSQKLRSRELVERGRFIRNLDPLQFNLNHYFFLTDFVLASENYEDVMSVVELMERSPSGNWDKLISGLRLKYRHERYGWRKSALQRINIILSNRSNLNSCKSTIEHFFGTK
ncbi:MAG: hypothetical protein KBD76_10145 [Bacteriovorax sp.]|nr:hypothetical protein [Bacteriovorax sp.]